MKTAAPNNDPAHWRRRADEARRAADILADADAKQTMLEMCADFSISVSCMIR